MRVRLWQAAVSLVLLLLLSLLASAQQPPPAGKQSPKDQAPKPRLDLYGDPLPRGAVRRFGSVRFRHVGAILSLAYSPDGKVVVSGGSDGTVRFWDVATGKQLRRIWAHGYPVSLAFSPDGMHVSAGLGGFMGGAFFKVQFLRVWDAATGEEIWVFGRKPTGMGSTERFNTITYSPDGEVLAAGTSKKVIYLWNARTGDLLRTLTGHQQQVTAIAFSPDGTTLASGSRDQTLAFWDPATGERLDSQHLPGRYGQVRHLAYSPGGATLVSTHFDGTIRVWDTATGKARRTLDNTDKKSLGAVAFSPDGKTFVTAARGLTLDLWDLETGERVRTIERAESTGRVPWKDYHGGLVIPVAFSPDGKTLAAGGFDTMIRFWDAGTGNERNLHGGHEGFVSAVSFSPDGRNLATGTTDDTIRLWDVETGKERRRLTGHRDAIVSLDHSSDGMTLASGSEDETVRLWDIATGKEIRAWDLRERAKLQEARRAGKSHVDMTPRPVTSVEFTEDGRSLLAACADESVFLIDPSGAEARLVADTGVRASGGRSAGYELPGGLQLHLTTKYYQDFHKTAAISPDGLRVVCRRTSSALETLDLLTELVESKLETEPEKHDDHRGILWNAAVRCLALSPDGFHLAFADPDGRIALWDMSAEAPITDWRAHEESISCLAFSFDGRMLASAAEDGRIRLWDPLRGTMLQECRGHEGWALSLAFSPRGDLLASGGLDCAALTWDVCAAREALEAPAAFPKPGLPAGDDLETSWDRLAEKEGAYEAIRLLALKPEFTLPRVRTHVQRDTTPMEDEARRLIAHLDDEDFAVREKAAADLLTMGFSAEGLIREALTKEISPEQRARLNSLIRSLRPPFRRFPSEALRSTRILHLLKWMDSPEAREILHGIAEKSPSPWLREQAGRVLEVRRGQGEGGDRRP